jgi:hypothetical protein
MRFIPSGMFAKALANVVGELARRRELRCIVIRDVDGELIFHPHDEFDGL